MSNEEYYFEEENLVNLELLSQRIKKQMIKDKLEQTINKIKKEKIPSLQAQSSQGKAPQVALDQQLMELM